MAVAGPACGAPLLYGDASVARLGGGHGGGVGWWARRPGVLVAVLRHLRGVEDGVLVVVGGALVEVVRLGRTVGVVDDARGALILLDGGDGRVHTRLHSQALLWAEGQRAVDGGYRARVTVRVSRALGAVGAPWWALGGKMGVILRAVLVLVVAAAEELARRALLALAVLRRA